jgi:ribosome biogenesis GTPase
MHGRNGHHAQPIRALERADPITVGDMVQFIKGEEGAGTILEVLPRRNKLARQSAVPMPSARPFEQVIAANVDQVVPVFAAASPAPRWNLLDRYLVSAESSGLPSLICITKLDLAKSGDGELNDELCTEVEEYRRIGYPVILASAVTGEGVNDLKEALRGRLSVFLGQSGVGKSSLLNAIQPGLGLRVNEVSRVTGKGKHTTTHLEMFSLNFGGDVVDTPGVREFGLWDVEEDDLALFFPEMQPLVGRCKFGMDCEHDEEPGCAIRKAVTAGKISPRRYRSYLKLKVDA